MGQSIEQFLHSVHEIQHQNPPLCEMRILYGNISGVFGGGNHKEIAEGTLILNPYEYYLQRYIQQLLATEDHPIRMLDEGALFGMSMAVMGYLFRNEIRSGDLSLLASNFEHHITKHALGLEAERRLGFVPLFEKLEEIKQGRGDHDNDNIYALQSSVRPIVQTREELAFWRFYSRYVGFLSGVGLDAIRIQYKDEPFDIVHDHYAGLTWAPERERFGIFTVLRPHTGMLITNTNLLQTDVYDYRIAYLTVTKLAHANDEQAPKYWIYATTGALVEQVPYIEEFPVYSLE